MSGHIQRRGRNSWRLKFDIGRDPLTNDRRTRYLTFKGTKRQAEQELINRMAEYNAGASVNPSKVTLSDYLADWHNDYAAVHVTPKTAERYKQLIKNQIAPNIGQVQLQRLQPAHLQGLYARLLKAGLAPRTVGHVHRLLRKTISHAGTMGLVQRNVATLVKPPKAEDVEITILTKEQIAKLLTHVKGRTIYLILVLGLATGARRGELLALRIKDFNPENGTVRIERSLEQTKGQLRFKVPKTKHGKRTVTVPPPVVAELKAHIIKVQERRLLLGMGRASRDDLLFPRWDGQVRSPHWLTQKFSQAMAALKIGDITLHSLRHTHASQLIASGMDVLTISRRLGHGSAAITLRVYGHLIEGKDAEAAKVMEHMFNSLRTE
jgi:integrase